jgi:hypothetical protein
MYADTPECQRTAGCSHLIVMAGLDPAIHLLSCAMDARVKPGHDELDVWRFSELRHG